MIPSAAIIMRAKDEMPYVQQALNMLEAQTFTDFELFAVDSGSTDGTFQALEKSRGQIRQIQPEEYIPGKVLNTAVRNTGHDMIVLLNADAVPASADWLELLLKPLIEQEADAVFCRQLARPDAAFIVNYDYERAYRREKMNPDFFSAVACAFKRNLWEALPFPESGYAEDARWAAAARRRGFTVRYVEDCAVEHSHNYTLPELFRKRYRQALTSDEPPNFGRQILRCLREIARDLGYAVSTFKLQHIPYNVIYRVTIHRAVYRGQKEHGKIHG